LRLRNTLLIGLWVLCGSNWAHSDDRVGEHDLKAAYVFNFIQFIDWPDNESVADRDWVICVSPFSPLKRPLIALDGKPTRKGQPVRVRLLEISDLRNCRLVVLHHADVQAVLRALRSMPPANGILTIAEEATSSSPEIMITLAQQEGRIVFGINTDATSRAGLTVSSRLLRLARAVQ
jgi:hypothetical protein